MTSSFIDFKDYKSICPSIHHSPTHLRAEWENGKFSEKYQQLVLVGSLRGLGTYIVLFYLKSMLIVILKTQPCLYLKRRKFYNVADTVGCHGIAILSSSLLTCSFIPFSRLCYGHDTHLRKLLSEGLRDRYSR